MLLLAVRAAVVVGDGTTQLLQLRGGLAELLRAAVVVGDRARAVPGALPGAVVRVALEPST